MSDSKEFFEYRLCALCAQRPRAFLLPPRSRSGVGSRHEVGASAPSCSAEAHNGEVSATNPADEYEALLHVFARVSRLFPSLTEGELLELIAGEVSRFGRARLREYVPVLVEGRVIRTLRGAAREHRTGEPDPGCVDGPHRRPDG